MSDTSTHNITATLDMLFSEHNSPCERETAERWADLWKSVFLISDHYWGLLLDFCDDLSGSMAFYQEWYRYHRY